MERFGREDQRLLMFSAMAGARSARPNVGDAATMEVAHNTGAVQPLQLSSLFDQLTVECSGQLVHPQWKHFRHMLLVKSERTRLSNAIWRSWYMQVIKERRPLYCSFNVIPPAEDQSHKKPQAVVLEGKYWRRKIDAVAEEYHKWRLWYQMKRKRQHQTQVGEARQQEVATGPATTSDLMHWDLNLDVPDSLFTSHHEAAHAQSREWSMDVTNTFQPNLTMLNPAIEDILDKLEPMEVLFPGLMAPPTAVPASQGRVDSLYSSGTGPATGTPPFQEMLPPADPFKVPRPPAHAISIPRPPDEPAPMSVSPMVSFMDKPGPSPYQQPMDGLLPPTAAKAIKQEPVAEVDMPFSNYGLPSPHCSTLESLLNQSVFPQSAQQAVGVAMAPTPQQGGGFPVHSPPMEAVTDASQDNRPFGNKLFDEKAQLHKSISSLQKLEQVQRQQMRELDKQRQRATQEYQDLLRQYISQTGEASTAQQQMLHSVVSDPTMMGILQTVLLQAQGSQQPLSASSTPPHPTTPNVFDAVATQPSVVPFRRSSAGEVGGIPADTQSPSVYDASTVSGAGSDSTLMSLLTSPGQGPSSQSVMVAPGESPPISLKNRSLKDMSQEEQHVYKEQRRQSHISAEQKRRGNIKHGFDRLQSMVIKMVPPSAGKMSKASVLLKSIEHIQHLQKQRQSQEAELELLKKQLGQLNSTINVYQEQLPMSGAPVTSQRFEENRNKFRDYVFARSAHNYKFWIFAAITRQLFESYNTTVSTTHSVDELCRTTVSWMDQNCTLPQLRRGALQGLREVSTSTAILTDPARVPQQVAQMVTMATAHSQRPPAS